MKNAKVSDRKTFSFFKGNKKWDDVEDAAHSQTSRNVIKIELDFSKVAHQWKNIVLSSVHLIFALWMTA